MKTRELRYFVAVAEELHSGRAATRVGIAQPPLSRAVAQLERRLGVQLLKRTSRGAVLTAAGAVLVTKAGASTELLAKLLDADATEPGAVPVDVELCGMGQQERWLRDGRAEVGLLHRPFDSTAGLDRRPGPDRDAAVTVSTLCHVSRNWLRRDS